MFYRFVAVTVTFILTHTRKKNWCLVFVFVFLNAPGGLINFGIPFP